MEVNPGVFVSNVATEDWRTDPEIGGGAEEHVGAGRVGGGPLISLALALRGRAEE
jgi:hypothetical protein